MMASAEIEREGSALLAEELAERWEASAAEYRKKTSRFFGFGKPYVIPWAEKEARTLESAASGLRTVARLIREGYAARAFYTKNGTP